MKCVRVVRVVKVVGGGERVSERIDISKEVWRILKIVFRVPYNVFKVDMIIDGSRVMYDVIDDTNDEIELYADEIKANRYIDIKIENTTTTEYTFKMALHIIASG